MNRVRTDPRISRRRKAVARTRRRMLMTRGIIVLALTTLVWAALFSPLLQVKTVEVMGARRTGKATVASAARVGAGDNLLRVSTSRIEERVEELPWVLNARVTRKLPNTLRVKVVERDPALVLSIGAARWTIDSSGRVLEVGEARKGLPVLAAAEVGEIATGADLAAPSVRHALKIFRSLPARLAKRVEALFAPTVERISFSIDGSTLIRYGPARGIRPKNRVLLAVLTRLDQEGRTVAYVDVRVPTSPAISQTSVPSI
jgi:cell division protein FtsQ